MGNEELEQQNETQVPPPLRPIPEKFSYSLKFSPKLYDSEGDLIEDAIEFKDSYEFSVKYNAEVTDNYFNWAKAWLVGSDGLPLYEKKNEIPVNVTNKYLFRASLEEVNFTPVNNSTVTEGATEGSGEGNGGTTTTVTEGDEEGAGSGTGVVTDDENPSSDTITDTGIKYVLEKNGYKITQPSNGNFVVTSDGTVTEDQKIYIYMIDPHTELYGTDEAYEPVKVDDVNYYGTYETDGSRRRKINKSTDKVNVDVLKNPTELDEKILEAELTFNGTALPEYTANVVTYEDANISDGELVMTLADGFTTDDIEVYTYPFSLNLVADTVEETVDEETVTKSVYKSDLNAVRPGIYQVYAVYKGRRLKLRDLIIKGDNILNPNMKLQSEETTVEETTTTTYFYNLEVGESILLSLYSNPIKDSKDVRLYKDGADNPAVDLKMLPNCPGCNPSAVLRVSEFVSDPITIKAINTLQPPANEGEDGTGANLAARIIKVIPIPQDKHYTAPVALPDTDKIKFFDEIVDIYRYADGRRVFSTNFGDDENPVNLYQIVTNEYEEDTEFAFEYAMLVNEFVRYSHTS